MNYLKVFFIILALAYLISPWDLLPDFMGLPGRIDDLAFIIFLYWKYHDILAKREKVKSRSGQPAAQTEERIRSPYEVLELNRSASAEEIDSQYRKLIAQYHPDKVHHLGDELKRVAHEKTIEIQRAYEQLRTK